MRAHKLQREYAHANSDEQQRKEYRELFSIDPQFAKRFLTQRRDGATKWSCFRCVVAPLREKFFICAP
jgi:hypothetical protein